MCLATHHGSAEVTVAVVDSGVDLNHPDLVDHMRSDGYDFIEDDTDPSDENGHGTHVTGIIAATVNNAIGISGLAPGVQILPIRALNAEGRGNDRTIAAGIRYATQQGARVINLSLGATVLLASRQTSQLVSAAIAEAYEEGVLVVVAAGNDFLPLPNAIVGDQEKAVTVAASTPDEHLSRFSNYGAWIDITAPGQRILSTMPTYDVFLTSDAIPASQRMNQDYDFMSGTSQAAPFVSAMAALLLSVDPSLSNRELEDVIERFADPRIYDNHPSNYRKFASLGAGRMDVCAPLADASLFPERDVGSRLMRHIAAANHQ